VSRALKAHILLILVTLVWGATFVVIKDALRDISPLLFNTVRMTLAAATLGLIYMGSLRRMTWDALKSGVLVGAFLWVGYEFQTTGLKLTTPSKSAFLTGVSVVLVPVFLALFWRKKLRPWTWAGVAMAFVGLYLLTVPAGEASSGGFSLNGVNLGDVLTLGCAIGFALQIIFMGRATRAHRFEQLATIQAATAAVLMAMTFPLVEHVYVVWSARVIWAIAITGLLGTAAAFTIQAWAQQFTSPTYTALIFALEPVFAWLTSYFVLRERLGYRGGLGAGLILVGIVVAELLGGTDADAAAAGAA
jgi:drug/metabolite transporter (DMT)-like permease